MLNKEQQLELILDYISNDISRFDGFAGEALVYYVSTECPELLTDDEVAEKCNQMIIDHSIASLFTKDLIDIEVDENGEEIFTLTEKGKKIDLT